MVIGMRHLRAFLIVAEEGSITRAANRLHLTQPAASRLLSQLEAHLGVRLAERSPHGFVLTEAGERLILLARAAVAAVEVALRPSAGPVAPIRLGYAWSALGADTARVLTAWRADPAHAVLQLRRIDDRLAGLAAGEVDVAIVRDLPPDVRVRRRPLFSESRVAALPAGHRLAAQATVTMRQLVDEPLVVNVVTGTTTASLWPAAEAPVRLVETRNTDDWLLAIAAGEGVGVSSVATAETHAVPQVTYRPLVDAPRVRVEVVWPDRPTHPQTAALIAHLQALRPPGRRHAEE